MVRTHRQIVYVKKNPKKTSPLKIKHLITLMELVATEVTDGSGLFFSPPAITGGSICVSEPLCTLGRYPSTLSFHHYLKQRWLGGARTRMSAGREARDKEAIFLQLSNSTVPEPNCALPWALVLPIGCLPLGGPLFPKDARGEKAESCQGAPNKPRAGVE